MSIAPRHAVPWAAVLLLAVAGCEKPAGPETTVHAYIRAVQERDVDRILDLTPRLSAAGEGAESHSPQEVEDAYRLHLEGQYARYEADRDSGALTFADDGVVLITALKLGRGAYYTTVETVSDGPDAAALMQEVRLGYRSMNLAGFPPGTTIYLLGVPLGTIYNPVIGEQRPARRRILEKVWLRWDLVRIDGRWRVAAVRPAARAPESFDDTTRF